MSSISSVGGASALAATQAARPPPPPQSGKVDRDGDNDNNAPDAKPSSGTGSTLNVLA